MDPAYAAVHAEEDREHWWFRGRRAVILAEMRRWLGVGGAARLAEIGCGSGGLLPDLARFGAVVGVEADPALRSVAGARGLAVMAGRLPDALPLEHGSLDAVGLFDVLEHVDDEAAALAAVRHRLRPGGLLFVTVPAHPWLWSRHDEVLGHRRRYTRRTLRAALERAALRVERLTGFNALLAPAVIATRVLKRLTGAGGHDLARPPAALNGLLAACFGVEARLLALTTLPFGISLLAVARRAPEAGSPEADRCPTPPSAAAR